MSSSNVFPTFCHISEFEDRGYRRLDTMVSLSLPLTLWSPSWKHLSSFAPEGFDAQLALELVDRGIIRVAAREDWINNGPRRQERAKDWEGAEWTTYDKTLARFAKDDVNIQPEQSRRVQIVADEDGYDRAKEFLDQRPDAIEKIERLVKNNRVPEGTHQRVLRYGLTGRKAAIEVIRDARNHGRAIKDTASKVPFLSLEYGKFIGFVGELDEPVIYNVSEKRTRSLRTLAQKTLDLMDDLARFGEPNLGRFAGSPAHIELAQWMNDLAETLKDSNVADLEISILRSLKRDIDKNFPYEAASAIESLRETFENEGIVEGFSRVFELLAGAVHPHDAWHIGGVAFVALRFGYKLLVSLGYAPLNYSGMSWPFLYVFGRRPRTGDFDTIEHYLKTRYNDQLRAQL